MGHHHHQHHHHGHHSYEGRYSDPPQYAYPSAYPPPLPPDVPPGVYGGIDPYNYALQPYSTASEGFLQQEATLSHAMAERDRHARNERVAEVGAAVAGAFALYEAHEAKVDPAHARRHKLEAEIAGAAALGSTAYAFHEHSEKVKAEHAIQSMGGVVGHHDHGHHHHHHRRHHH